MLNVSKTPNENSYHLFLFTFLLAILTYGFTLTNFSLSIDNEIPIFSDYGLDLGRWGTNLIRYHIFSGHLQYFSFILSLFMFSISAVRLANLFKFEGILAYFFCGLFLTFPQISYQVVFNMMADVASFGILLSVLSVEIFIKQFDNKSIVNRIMFLILVALLLMFTLSIYQALVLAPVTIYIIHFFLNTFNEDFNLKEEMKRAFSFAGLILLSGILYYISVKIICPPIEQSSYLSSFTTGNSDNRFSSFIKLWKTHLNGKAYYGERLLIIIPFLISLLTIKFLIIRKLFFYRFLILLFLILSPFIISFFITNGYHPPRLYLTTNLVFAFVIVFVIKYFKLYDSKLIFVLTVLMLIFNIYFVTKLFQSNNSLYKHDKRIAEKIDNTIQSKYPDFYTTDKLVYFYGYFPYEYHQRFRLENSEIFGGSIFNWDNGNNYRLINFFKDTNIAEYKMLDTKEMHDSVKDSIQKMPVWPKDGSVKLINKIVVVKLGETKGMALPFE